MCCDKISFTAGIKSPATTMRVATGVLFVLTALAAPILASPYPKACNKGPEYWCANFRNAEECDATGHCLQTVWTKQKYDIDSDLVAIKITKLFQQLKTEHGKYNDEELQSLLESSCRSVPHVAAGLRCKGVLSGRATAVRSLLTSDLSAGAVCGVLSLCNDAKMDNLLATPKHKRPENPKPVNHKTKLLGSEKCTWGPSYWCTNLTTSHDCRTTSHCIQQWSVTPVPVDSDDICKICTDMVKQARDQLMSNETQEELKEVFDGSCKLIPIKIVAKECMKLADDFVPELVETLVSEMNPSQVCSVAGLCNSQRIDKLLAVYEERKAEEMKGRKECSDCRRVVSIARSNFDSTSYEDFLHNLLKMCRKAGSYSDSCAMHVFTRYEDIVSALREHLKPDSVCHLSGQCAYKYHSHADDYIELSHSGSSGVIVGDKKEDLPCELCEQLVKHMRDVIIANTTESEFLIVLKGICKQTGNFKDECLTLVEQWYPVIYNYLVSDLKPDEVCALGGICPTDGALQNVPIAPLVTSELVVVKATSDLIGADKSKSSHVKIPSKQSSVRVLATKPPQPIYSLPIERMFIAAPQTTFQSKEGCILCQQLLHYIQVEISDSNNEEVIKRAVENACKSLPPSVNDECTQFVEAYGPAVIALLVQEIDPSSVCPALRMCPSVGEIRRVDIHAGHSSCPLCLFAVEQLETVLRNNKTEEKIRTALGSLCRPLSEKLKPACLDFVDQYSEQLVEMLIADLNAQEICVFLKICKDTPADPLGVTRPSESAIDKFHDKPHLRGDVNRMRKRPHSDEKTMMIETNEIPDQTYDGRPLKSESGKNADTVCVLCEFVLKEIDSEIKDKKNEDDLKLIVHRVCKRMPKSVRSQCDQFVDKYADLVISLLSQELDPDEVCRELKLCPNLLKEQRSKLKEEILECAVCETVMMAVEKVLENPAADRRVIKVAELACDIMSAKYYDRCHTLMEIYGNSIISIIFKYGSKGTCHKIGLCGDYEGAYLQMFREGHN